MSVKKRSFLCKIVHKMVENARFFAQKRTFLHIFAGGRGDFLAGQIWGFFGSRVSRERHRPRRDFVSKSPRGESPTEPIRGRCACKRIDSYRNFVKWSN